MADENDTSPEVSSYLNQQKKEQEEADARLAAQQDAAITEINKKQAETEASGGDQNPESAIIPPSPVMRSPQEIKEEEDEAKRVGEEMSAESFPEGTLPNDTPSSSGTPEELMANLNDLDAQLSQNPLSGGGSTTEPSNVVRLDDLTDSIKTQKPPHEMTPGNDEPSAENVEASPNNAPLTLEQQRRAEIFRKVEEQLNAATDATRKKQPEAEPSDGDQNSDGEITPPISTEISPQEIKEDMTPGNDEPSAEDIENAELAQLAENDTIRTADSFGNTFKKPDFWDSDERKKEFQAVIDACANANSPEELIEKGGFALLNTLMKFILFEPQTAYKKRYDKEKRDHIKAAIQSYDSSVLVRKNLSQEQFETILDAYVYGRQEIMSTVASKKPGLFNSLPKTEHGSFDYEKFSDKQKNQLGEFLKKDPTTRASVVRCLNTVFKRTPNDKEIDILIMGCAGNQLHVNPTTGKIDVAKPTSKDGPDIRPDGPDIRPDGPRSDRPDGPDKGEPKSPERSSRIGMSPQKEGQSIPAPQTPKGLLRNQSPVDSNGLSTRAQRVSGNLRAIGGNWQNNRSNASWIKQARGGSKQPRPIGNTRGTSKGSQGSEM